QETHAAQWIGFRQPVLRRFREARGETFEWTWQANPGEVWEEDEFWIALSWRVDPDGSLGIRKWFESPYRPGERITIEEYYRWIFENSVPGLPEAAAAEGSTPLEYMQRHGAFLVRDSVYTSYASELDAEKLRDAERDPEARVLRRNGKVIGVLDAAGTPRAGFPTPSGRIEISAAFLRDWGWPEYVDPGYIESHVHERHL